jgi:hypothetical protein
VISEAKEWQLLGHLAIIFCNWGYNTVELSIFIENSEHFLNRNAILPFIWQGKNRCLRYSFD